MHCKDWLQKIALHQCLLFMDIFPLQQVLLCREAWKVAKTGTCIGNLGVWLLLTEWGRRWPVEILAPVQFAALDAGRLWFAVELGKWKLMQESCNSYHSLSSLGIKIFLNYFWKEFTNKSVRILALKFGLVSTGGKWWPIEILPPTSWRLSFSLNFQLSRKKDKADKTINLVHPHHSLKYT